MPSGWALFQGLPSNAACILVEVFGFGEYFPGVQEGYFSMASSVDRLDAKSNKTFGENVTTPKIDKRLHDSGNTHN